MKCKSNARRRLTTPERQRDLSETLNDPPQDGKEVAATIDPLTCRLDQAGRREDLLMTVVNVHDAKTQLSKLIEKAAAGNDVVIARGGKPVARLTRLGSSKRKLKFGILKGEIKISADFDASVSSDVLRQFEGT